MDTQLSVLFEDNHVIAVFKSAGILTQGDCTGAPSLFDMTKDWLKEKYSKPGNVFLGLLHRLDQPCAGVVVFAKTSKAASRLSAQIRSRTVDKKYRVLVEGTLLQPAGELIDPLESREAKLRYRRLRSEGKIHLLEVELITGRKHQIRMQFSMRGLPVLGDTKYGSTTSYTPGIALLCYQMAFDHPTSKERIVVQVPKHLSPLAQHYA